MLCEALKIINIDDAREAVREGFVEGLALFVGAGLSLQSPSNCPPWSDLTSEFIRGVVAAAGLRDRADLTALLEELPRFMMVALRRPEHTFQVLTDVLDEGVLEGLALLRTGDANLNHILIGGYLWLGALRAVITTNFDEHLEQTVRLHEDLCGESPSHLPYRQLRGKVVGDSERVTPSRLLWAIHGSLSDLSSVVTSVAAAGQSFRPNAIETFQSIAEDCTLLVVGYSGNDEDIIELLLAPETVVRARGIIWQVLDETEIPPVVSRLHSAYGDRMVVVQGTADDLFSLTIDPLFIGNFADDSATWEAALAALRTQWRAMLVSSMPPDYRATFSSQFNREYRLLANNQHVRTDYSAPGSVIDRVNYLQMALCLLEGPAASELADMAAPWAAAYRSELEWLRHMAPTIVLGHYPRESALLALASLLTSCRCYEEALEVARIGSRHLEDESKDAASPTSECYLRLRALSAIVLVCLDKPDAALQEVALVRSAIESSVSRSLLGKRATEQMLLAETWAMVRLNNRFSYSEVRSAAEALHSFDRELAEAGIAQPLLNVRSEYDRELLTLAMRHEDRLALCEMLDETVRHSLLVGDSLRASLLKGMRAEVLGDASDKVVSGTTLEEVYQEVLRLGASFELIQLCKIASSAPTIGSNTSWSTRLDQHRAEVLNQIPQAVRQLFVRLVERI